MKKAYEDLTFADNFMFCKIMSTDPDICKGFLELFLDVKIRGIVYSQKQKEIEITYDGKGVRLDAYVEDEDNTVYDIEMQKVDTQELPKRSRYYQGMIDLDMIEKGADYNELKKSYIIFVCLTDPFKMGLPMYTFENKCIQNKDLILNDESIKVFVNASSEHHSISPRIRHFLDYIRTNVAKDEFTRRISKSVKKAIEHKKWRIEYMTYTAFYHDAKVEGRIEGRIMEYIAIRREDGMPDETIVSNLMKRFSLSPEEAKAAIKDYEAEKH